MRLLLPKPWMFLGLACSFFFGAELQAAEVPRNVVVILADDFGYGSVGFQGAEGLKTPHLDRLAREGRRFTQAYAPGSVCSPSRYGLLTGRYFWRTSIKDGGVLAGNAPLHFEPDRPNLGSIFQEQGYRTAAIGKWHLGLGGGKETDWNVSLQPGPTSLGFDYFFGISANALIHPLAYIENDGLLNRISGQPVSVEKTEGGQTTHGISPVRELDEVMDRFTEKAVEWIEGNRDERFFLYFSPNAVHEPLTPSSQWVGTSPYGPYGDFIQQLDGSVGQILDTLDRLNLADDTLVIFTGDNGGIVHPNNKGASTAIQAGLAINGAFRGGKHEIWEGGFREPFVVRWPGKIQPGTVSDEIISLTDLLATLGSLIGADIPTDASEDGFDVSPALLGTGPSPRDFVVLQDSYAIYSIRKGPWKLIERENPPAFTHRNPNAEKRQNSYWRKQPRQDELFHLIDDPAETKDVAAEHPEIVAELRAALAKIRNEGRSRP
ncbi:sulfatase family protein [Planctomicrobium sp. SH661]|uniref:sulfatase family protein n=1 Tax=Planctomicrobium sp. SH661 TaxID=3448124 RepID=UPI003F5B3676